MNCAACGFEDTLMYTVPARDGWGVTRIGQLLPQSHQLFAGPAACGRHGALSACLQGRRSRVTYLMLTEEELVSGRYEQAILDGAERTLARLTSQGRRPRVMVLFLTCVDDLLATDHGALTAELASRHPGVRFIDAHMNPLTTDSRVPPKAGVRARLYSTLDPADRHDGGVNLLGSLVRIRDESRELLRSLGAAPLRQMQDFDRFDDFQAMAQSRLNLVTSPQALEAARQMERRLGIPFLRSWVSYRPEAIEADCRAIAAALGAECPDLRSLRDEAEAALEGLCQLCPPPLVLDGDACLRPFDLARAFLERGIAVKRLFVQKVPACDEESFQWLRQNHPETEILQPQHFRRALDGAPRVPDGDCAALGLLSGYLTGSPCCVPLTQNMGHWGFDGVMALADLLRESLSRPLPARHHIIREEMTL